MLSEDRLRNLEVFGILCWLVKDLGWVLLLWPLAWSAAALSLVTAMYELALRWKVSPVAILVHHVAGLTWLVGNVVWLVFEMLYYPSEKVGRRYPWFSGPLAGPNPDAYQHGMLATQVILGSGLALLFGFYMACATVLYQQNASGQEEENPRGGAAQTRQELVLGRITPEVYSWVFIGPWMLKDLFWTLDLLIPALLSVSIVVSVLLDCWRRSGSRLYIAELFWALGNTAWIMAEVLLQDDERWPREVAGTLLMVGCVILLIDVFQKNHGITSLPGEVTPLAAGAAAAAGQPKGSKSSHLA